MPKTLCAPCASSGHAERYLPGGVGAPLAHQAQGHMPRVVQGRQSRAECILEWPDLREWSVHYCQTSLDQLDCHIQGRHPQHREQAGKLRYRWGQGAQEEY